MVRISRKRLQVSDKKNTVYNAAGYVRLSVTKERSQSDSIETQIKMINEFIDTQSNIHLHKFYVDKNEKGTSFNRTEFQNMITDILDRKIDCVIVKDLSRLVVMPYQLVTIFNNSFPVKK